MRDELVVARRAPCLRHGHRGRTALASSLEVLAIAFLLSLLAGCSRSASWQASSSPTLSPPPGTGTVLFALDGTWQVSDVQVDQEQSVPTQPGATPWQPSGMIPPCVGDRLDFDVDGFVQAAGKPMRRHECERFGWAVEHYLNQVDRRFAIYDMQCHVRHHGHGMPGGFRMQMAFGTVPDGTLLGEVCFQQSGTSLASGTPVFGLYTVRLERVP